MNLKIAPIADWPRNLLPPYAGPYQVHLHQVRELPRSRRRIGTVRKVARTGTTTSIPQFHFGGIV